MQKVTLLLSGLIFSFFVRACEKSEQEEDLFSKYALHLEKKAVKDFKDFLTHVNLPDDAFEKLKKSKEYKDRVAIVRKGNQLFTQYKVVNEEVGLPLVQHVTLAEIFLSNKTQLTKFAEHVKNIIKYAAYAGSMPVLKDFFKRFKVDLPLEKNFLPIHWAAYGANLAAVKLFITTKPALIREVTETGSTPLHLVCLSKKKQQEKNQVFEIVGYLLDKNADVNALMFSEGEKITPLDCVLSDNDQTSQHLVTFLKKEASALTGKELQLSASEYQIP